jgi:hypothetical protein
MRSSLFRWTPEIVWFRQLLVGDMGNAACLAVDKANCPEPHGPDFDLGASANLITLPNGRRLLTIGQKSGMVWALDPDDRGRILWQARVGRGGPLGGVQWGTATDGRTVYAAVSDIAAIDLVIGQPVVLDPDKGGGLHALIATPWIDAGGVQLGGQPVNDSGKSGEIRQAAGFIGNPRPWDNPLFAQSGQGIDHILVRTLGALLHLRDDLAGDELVIEKPGAGRQRAGAFMFAKSRDKGVTEFGGVAHSAASPW